MYFSLTNCLSKKLENSEGKSLREEEREERWMIFEDKDTQYSLFNEVWIYVFVCMCDVIKYECAGS